METNKENIQPSQLSSSDGMKDTPSSDGKPTQDLDTPRMSVKSSPGMHDIGETPPEVKPQATKLEEPKPEDEEPSETDQPSALSQSLNLEEEPVPFVEGWNFVATLGEGAFGKVRLAVSTDNLQKVAIKIIDFVTHPECQSVVQKEIHIHKRLQHDNIIQYYGDRTDEDQTTKYIFLEYANGTELYDRIDPDKGLSHRMSRNYFHQLLLAVQYIHSQGFTHRDIKPENILITKDDKLKLIDFGLATVFRFKNKNRRLAKRCGTPPYLAPEVLVGMPYDAEPAEIWSCGIVLIAMLAGELPWAEASCESDDWNDWLDKSPELESKTPWTKLDMDTLAFTRKILHHKPGKRLKIEGILNHRWMDPEKQELVGSQKVGEISKRLQQSRLKPNVVLPSSEAISNSKKRGRGDALFIKSNHVGLSTCSQVVEAKRVKTDSTCPFDDSGIASSTQPIEIQNLYLSKSQVPQGFSQYLRSSGFKNWETNSVAILRFFEFFTQLFFMSK